MTDEANRHYWIAAVNSVVQVRTTAGTIVCSCDDAGDAARIMSLLEADEQRKKKQ